VHISCRLFIIGSRLYRFVNNRSKTKHKSRCSAFHPLLRLVFRPIVYETIDICKNNKINKNGAILVFSTHYPSLLDEFDRNDNTYIIRNEGGISIENLASRFTRNDIKKSVAYESNYLDGTAPSYEAYMDFKRFLRDEIK